MIPASTLMEPTKHQGKRNLKIKTASHFTPFCIALSQGLFSLIANAQR
jgi:hypothetical protein